MISKFGVVFFCSIVILGDFFLKWNILSDIMCIFFIIEYGICNFSFEVRFVN